MTELVALASARFVALLPAGLRVAGMVLLAPGLGAERAPAQVRVALAVGLAAVVVPVAVRQPPPVAGPGQFIGQCLAELAFGAALGIALSALLEAFRFGGEILDLQMGLRAGQLFDPTSGTQSGILSTAYYMTALLLFVQLNGHHWLLRGLAASFAIAPVGTLSADPSLQVVVADIATSMLAIGVGVAAPVIAALLLADLAFGLVARAVPQVNVFIVGIPAKIALGLAIAAAAAPMLVSNLDDLIRTMAHYLDLILRGMS